MYEGEEHDTTNIDINADYVIIVFGNENLGKVRSPGSSAKRQNFVTILVIEGEFGPMNIVLPPVARI